MQNEATKWYQLEFDDVLNRLNSSKKGLTEEEAEKRLKEQGPNRLPREKRFRLGLFLLSQLKSPLIYILIIGGSISIAIEHNLDAIIIFAAVAVNIGIGFYQEYSSGKTLEKLTQIVKVIARVQRNGDVREIDSEKLVIGDIIHIKAGMKVPADARLIYAKNLEANESLLTGESSAVNKNTNSIKEDVVVGDRKNMIFTGSIIEKGEGIGIVVKTSGNTEVGKIAELTKKAEEDQTPLQQRMGHLGKIIAIIVTIASVLIVGVGWYEKIEFTEIFITSIAVAVAAIPEGLPATIAVILAVSSRRILTKKGLVKQLIAAESLGSTSVICSDKTGTLTEGKMSVEKIVSESDKKEFYLALALANEALVEKPVSQSGNTPEGPAIKGESTDQAKMQAFLENSDMTYNELMLSMPRLNILPFDPKNKFIASFHKKDSGIRVYITGTPEKIIELSESVDKNGEAQKITEEYKKEAELKYEEMAKDGLRMIAAAYVDIQNNENEVLEYNEKEMVNSVKNITYLGLAAIKDPIREGVKEIIKEVNDAGIRLDMLTGDHKLTALAIGKELGLPTDQDSIMEGAEMDKISDEDLRTKIREIDIFARVNPEHKLRIVKAWKEVGEVVAVTGDGINDAPALKVADVGVAVGSGTDVTKEAADLILLDDSFLTIVEAIKQGRTAFDNIKKVTVFMLSNSFTEVILILGALLFKIPLPLIAVQILWTNLVEDGLPNFALAFEPPEDDVLKRKPIERNKPILDREASFIAYPLGIMTDIILFSVFFFFLKYSHYDISYIRTIIFATLGTDSLFFIFSLKSLDKSIFKMNLFNNRYLLFAIALGFAMMVSAVYLPQLNHVLRTSPLLLQHALLVMGIGITKLFIIEFVKLLHRRHFAGL